MTRSFIVSFSFNEEDPSKSVCIVGEKQILNGTVIPKMEIVNAFQGSDADDIFKVLMERKGVDSNAGD